MSMFKCAALASIFIAFFAAPVLAEEEKAPKWYDTLTVGGGVTTIVQTSSGNNDPADRNSGDNIDFTNSVDIGIEADVGPDQKLSIALEAGIGNGLTGRVGSSTFRPNYDAYPTTYSNTGGAQQQGLTVSQAYYQGAFFDHTVMLMVGRMDCHSMVDQNAFANSETTQFIGGPFVRTPGALYPEVGRNGQYYANGVTVVLTPNELFEVTLMAANGESDKAGNGGHTAGQLNIRPKMNGQPGDYRFYILQDDRTYADITTGDLKASVAYGVSFDQFLSDDIGFFFRYSHQDPKLQIVDSNGTALGIDPLEAIMSGGFQFSGSLWNREADAVGIGYATGKMKPDVKTALETSLGGSLSGDQSMIEAYYRWQATPKIGLSADVQSHGNLPRLKSREFTAFALRMQLDF